MPLEHSGSRSAIASNIHEMMASGHPHNVAVAAALHTADMAHAMGGIIAQRRDYGGGIGGVQPSATSENPMEQGQIQRYASMPVEKLQELATMLGSSPQGQIVQRLLQQKRSMPNAAPQQSPQVAPQASLQPGGSAVPPVQQQHRGGFVRRAAGGDMGISPGQASPWWTKAEARTDTGSSGFLSGSTPGRADALHTQAPSGSYILPADVVAGLGEGNSLAGARVVDEMLRSGPHGIPQAQGSRGRGPPAPPRMSETVAKGGGVHGGKDIGKLTPVALSHGEYFVAPEHVVRIGGGDLKTGHRVLDHWVQLERERQIKKLKALPPPVGAKKKAA